MLHTVKIENHHNLFAVSETLETWTRKVYTHLAHDPNNLDLAASRGIINRLTNDSSSFFPAWRFGFRYTLKGKVFSQCERELYLAFDDAKTIQGLAVCEKEVSQDGNVTSRKLSVIITCPDNLPSVPTTNKVRHVGKALLFHIVSKMESEKTSVPLFLEYIETAKGFYEGLGFSCKPHTDTGILPGGRAFLQPNRFQTFLQKASGSQIEVDEPEFLTAREEDKDARKQYERTLLLRGEYSIQNGLENGQFRSCCKLTQEEVNRLKARMGSLFCLVNTDLFRPKERDKVFARLSYLPSQEKESPVPELGFLPPLTLSDFLKSQQERIRRLVALFLI